MSETSGLTEAPHLFALTRRLARQWAVQALYQWQMTGCDAYTIEAQFWEEPAWLREYHVKLHQFEVFGRLWTSYPLLEPLDQQYFRSLLEQISENSKALDAQLQPLLDRPLQQLDPVEHAILWVGLYELNQPREVPWRVAINEAIELAKRFGASQSHKYINGVLDKLVRQRQVG
jgi:N utilization substance protein B